MKEQKFQTRSIRSWEQDLATHVTFTGAVHVFMATAAPPERVVWVV